MLIYKYVEPIVPTSSAVVPPDSDQTQLTLSIWIKDNVHFYDCKTSCRIALVRLVVATGPTSIAALR